VLKFNFPSSQKNFVQGQVNLSAQIHSLECLIVSAIQVEGVAQVQHNKQQQTNDRWPATNSLSTFRNLFQSQNMLAKVGSLVINGFSQRMFAQKQHMGQYHPLF